jgi:hypothetical protein
VPGGSGFNKAVARTIGMALSALINVCPGDTHSMKLSVRIAVACPVIGTEPRGSGSTTPPEIANSVRRLVEPRPVSFTRRFALGAGAGSGPKKTIDVFVDGAVGAIDLSLSASGARRLIRIAPRRKEICEDAYSVRLNWRRFGKHVVVAKFES